MGSGGFGDVDQVPADHIRCMHPVGDIDHRDDVVGVDHRIEVVEGRMLPMRVEHLEFLRPRRVPHGETHHETVELGLRKRVGSFMLDGVLCGDDDKRRSQGPRHPVDGHLAFLHGF